MNSKDIICGLIFVVGCPVIMVFSVTWTMFLYRIAFKFLDRLEDKKVENNE